MLRTRIRHFLIHILVRPASQADIQFIYTYTGHSAPPWLNQQIGPPLGAHEASQAGQ